MLAKLPSAIWAIPAAALVLLWPALLNGYPFLFPDTDPYIKQGHQIFPALRDWLAGEPTGIDYMQARSFALGAYLCQVYRVADFWGVAVIQALTMAWLVWTTAKAFGASTRAFAAIVAVLALTTAPFEAVYMMPDAWTAMGVLAGLLLLLAHDRIGLAAKIMSGAIFLFFLLAHSTHLALALLLVVGAIGMLVFLRATLRKALLVVVPLLALIAGSVIINSGVQAAVSSDLTTNPFLTARLLEDGPGRKHLDAACAEDPNAYELCRFKANPLDDVLVTLFSDDPQGGAFALAGREGQIRLNEEQSRFVIGSVLGDPLGTIGAALANGTRLLLKFSLADFHSPNGWSETSAPEWGDKARGQIVRALSYHDNFPLGPASVTIYAVVIVSLVFLVWRLTRQDIIRLIRSRTADSATLLAGGVVLIALLIIANAFLCGALSGVYDRYQARIIWLLPLAAALVAVRFGFRAETTPSASGT